MNNRRTSVVKNYKTSVLLTCFLSGCLTVMSSVSAFADKAPEAGIVVLSTGQATAQGADKTNRPLTRRSPVFVGDKLVTSADSQVQLRMKDGAMISLGPTTQFIIKAYSDDAKGDKKDAAVLSLVEGGLRTISGSIDKSAYKLETPVATLGIRGTVFDVYVAGDGTTTVVLREGAVDITGDTGVIQKLDVAGLAVVIERGKPPKQPGPVPLEMLKFLKAFMPNVPDDVTWQLNDDGSTSINIGDDIINLINTPPPMTNGDGTVPGEQEKPAPQEEVPPQYTPPPCYYC